MHDPSPFIEQFQRRIADLEQLTYRSAHDLKGPLVTIAGFLKGLTASAKTGRWTEFDTDLAHISHAIAHMERQLDDLLQLAKLNQPAGPPQALSIPQLVRDARVLIEPQHLMVKTNPDGPLVLGQEPQLIAVFQNLFANSVKFRTDAHQFVDVDVNYRHEGEQVLVRVRDHGKGIPEADRERVFEPFIRLKAKQPGTGLGLSIVKRTIERHGGRVWMESPPSGPGVVVCFTLPIAMP